jgi:hypothetical protein
LHALRWLAAMFAQLRFAQLMSEQMLTEPRPMRSDGHPSMTLVRATLLTLRRCVQEQLCVQT